MASTHNKTQWSYST